MEPPEPKLPVLKRAGFTLRGDHFGVSGHSRVPGSHLLELFAPERLRLKRDQKRASEEAHRLFSKPFFTAQLRYYGIKFKSTDRRDQLEDILKAAVLAGKCNAVPKSVRDLERSMKPKYAPLYRAWELERDAWKKRWDAWRRKQDDVMEEHRSVVELVKREGPRVNPKSMIPPDLLKSVGSYVVRCKELEDSYTCKDYPTLDIGVGPHYTVMQAAMDFSVIEGTMLLAPSDKILDDFIRRVDYEEESDDDDEEHSDDDGSDSDDDDEGQVDDEEDSEGEYDEAALVGSSKRRRAPSPKRKPGRPRKKARAEEPRQRVFVRFRGRETGEGEILPDPKQGHLDFTDGTYTSFRGILDLPYVGSAVEI